MNAIVVAFKTVVGTFPYFLLGLLILYLGKYVFDWTTPRIEDDKELTERDNPAFGVLFAGYLIGLSLSIAGAFFSFGDSILVNIVNIATSGGAGIILLRLGMLIGDKVILYSFSVEKEIVQDRNVGTGFVMGGLLIATGLIIEGVMSGQSASYLLMLRDIVVYWVAGQVLLILGGLLFQLLARYDVRKTIEDDDNTAAGISMGGYFVAVGIIMKAALTGTTSHLGPELLVTLVVGVLGMVILVLARFLTDAVLLPKGNLPDEVSRQKNTAAGAVAAVGFIAVALLFGRIITTQFLL